MSEIDSAHIRIWGSEVRPARLFFPADFFLLAEHRGIKTVDPPPLWFRTVKFPERESIKSLGESLSIIAQSKRRITRSVGYIRGKNN